MKSSRFRFSLLLVAAVLLTAAAPPLPRTSLQAGPHTFDVEVAATREQRAQGLMGRADLADGAGMLFVFEQPDRHCFWMKDTAIPLSIAFLADDGTIVEIADMQPHALDRHCAPVPVLYALEVKRGGFGERSIRPGTQVRGGPFGGHR